MMSIEYGDKVIISPNTVTKIRFGPFSLNSMGLKKAKLAIVQPLIECIRDTGFDTFRKLFGNSSPVETDFYDTKPAFSVVAFDTLLLLPYGIIFQQ